MKRTILFPIIFFGTFFVIAAILFLNGRRALENISFNGEIEKLVYDEKSIATVTVKGISYHLTPLRKEFRNRVRVGDIIKKDKESSSYSIVKKGSGEIIIFDF